MAGVVGRAGMFDRVGVGAGITHLGNGLGG